MTNPSQLSGRRRHRSPARRQSRGMVLLMVMLFLIGTVVFVLTQMLGISSNNVIDGQRQSESHSAFFIAESGLERATAALTTALESSYTNASCTGLAATASIGRGSVSITATSNPATCDNAGATPCVSCTVTTTGTVDGATRTVSQELQLSLRNGVHCTANCTNRGAGSAPLDPPTWQMKAKNTSTYGAIGVFNLVYDNRAASGGQNIADCPTNWAACVGQVLQLDVDAPPNRTGNNGNIQEYSVGLLGNTVAIPTGTAPFVYQRTSEAARPLVEVGGLFYGSTAAPTLTSVTSGAAAYWDVRSNRTGIRTIGTNQQQTGRTNNGTWTASGSCNTPSSTSQSCTNWCYGGDTLVYLFGGSPIRPDRNNDPDDDDDDDDDDDGDSTGGTVAQTELTRVRFAAANNNYVDMTRLVKYPTAGIAGSPTDVHAEIWYARNPNLVDPDTVRKSPEGTGVSSYKGRGTGAVGASWSTTSNAGSQLSGTTLTIAAGQISWPQQIILPGDTLTSSGSGTDVQSGTTIVQQLTSSEAGGMTTGRGGAGTYQVSRSQTVSGTGRTWTISSSVLNVSACSVCFLAQNDPVSLPNLTPTNRTINAAQAGVSNQFGRTEVAGGVGRYPISGSVTRVAPSPALATGTSGTTLYIPATSAAPALTSPAMRIAIKSGTGELDPNTTVTSVSAVGSPNAATRSFVVSSTPDTPLDNATICAGTCALFNHSSGATSETSFSWSVNNQDTTFGRWASGFICLRGVDVNPRTVSGSSLGSKRWQERVQ